MARLWFRRHRYGFGWTPVTWQGFTVLAAALVVIGAAAVVLGTVAPEDAWWPVAVFIALTTVVAAALVRVSMVRGPAPRWRWGRRPDDDPSEDL